MEHYSSSIMAEAVVDSSYNPSYNSNNVNNTDTEYMVVASVPVASEYHSSSFKVSNGADFVSGIVDSSSNSFSMSGATYLAPRAVVTTKTIELFENERYSPMSGWSARGLLMTDRKTISTNDGESSWSDFKEAEIALISHGWKWDIDCPWLKDVPSQHGDQDGWRYSVDFGSFKESNGGALIKGRTHFVRRRRFTRDISFSVSNVWRTGTYNHTCDHCDLQDVDKLSALLMDSFARLSVVQYPVDSKFRIEKAVKVKNQVIEACGLTDNRQYQYSFSAVETALNNLCRKPTRMMSSNMFGDASVGGRQTAAAALFVEDERRQLARLIIRRFDTDMRFHCALPNCGPNCVFAAYGCANSGCAERFSQKWLPGHDAVCPYKIVACSSMCGECMPRMQLQAHLSTTCDMRMVQCPYYGVGCTNHIVCRALPQHCVDCVESHLSLSVAAVRKVQEDIAAKDRTIASLKSSISYYNTH